MPNPNEMPAPDPIEKNQATVKQDQAAQIAGERTGQPSLFTCPECAGTLWQVDQPELLQFRCHVGHILTGEALFAGQTTSAENSLWYTIRTLTDHRVLAQELAEFARRRGETGAAADFEAHADAAGRQVQALRQIAERSI